MNCDFIYRICKCKLNKINEKGLGAMCKFKNFVNGFISIIGMVIFAVLIYLAYTTTLINIGYEYEMPTLFKDSIFINIFVILGICLLCYLLNKLINKFYEKINTNILMILVSIFMVLASIIWILSSNACPEADQEHVCLYADEFNNNDYFGLLMGQYMGMHQHQLGLCTILRIMFALFGDYNYRSFQILNALSLGLLVISGTMIIRNMHFNIDTKKTEIHYLLLMLLCTPLYIYTDFVYGEILSIVFSFFTFWNLLSYLNNHKTINLIFTLLGLFIACFVRRNTIIIAIAIALVLLVKLIIEHNKYIVLGLITVILAATLSFEVPNIIYGKYIPSDSVEMPSTLYIAMGLRGENGYYDGYNLATYIDVNFKPDEANEVAISYIKTRLAYFDNHKEEAYTFFYNKLNCQWNVPLFQCYIMNHNINGNSGRLGTLLYEGVLNKITNIVGNYYHLFIYTMLFIFAIYSFKNRKEIKLEDYIFLVYIIGGFLFSIIWEAKARYILPYFICMIPYCSIMINILINKFRLNK